MMGEPTAGSDGSETISVRFTAGGIDRRVQVNYSYGSGSGQEAGPFGAIRKSGEQWVADDAVFNVIDLSEIASSRPLEEVLGGEDCALTVTPSPSLAESGGEIAWTIVGASGTFDPSNSTQTVFAAGANGGTATITATYTAHDTETRSHLCCELPGYCRIVSKPGYAILGQSMDERGRNIELVAEGAAEGGSFDWEVVEGGSTSSDQFVDQTVSGKRCTVLFKGDAPGPVKVKVTYSANTGDGQIGGEATAEFTVYVPCLDWEREPAHDWISVNKTVKLTAEVSGEPGTPQNDDDSIQLDASNVHWEATAGETTATGDGSTFTLTLGEEDWSIEACVRAQRQGPQAPQTVDMAPTGGESIGGVRLYIEGHDLPQTVDLGQQITLTAGIANAPDVVNGTFTWTCGTAEFRQGATWVKGEISTGTSVTLRLTEPSSEAFVDVTYEADVAYPPSSPGGAPQTVRITLEDAWRWDETAEQYVDDRAVFRVRGLCVVSAPACALNGYAMDVDGMPTRLVAKAYPVSSSVPFTWFMAHWRGDCGDGAFEDQMDVYNPATNTSTSTVTFRGSKAGLARAHVKLNLDLNDDGVNENVCRYFPVHDLRVEIVRDPTHDWVSMGGKIDLTATLYADPGTSTYLSDDLKFESENIYWEAADEDDNELTKTGSTLAVTLGNSPWTATAEWRVANQQTGELPEEPPEASATLPKGVRLTIDHSDDTLSAFVGQTCTVSATLSDTPGGDTSGVYTWTAQSARFYNRAYTGSPGQQEWLQGSISGPWSEVSVQFTESGTKEVSVSFTPNVVPDAVIPCTWQNPTSGQFERHPLTYTVINVTVNVVRADANPVTFLMACWDSDHTVGMDDRQKEAWDYLKQKKLNVATIQLKTDPPGYAELLEFLELGARSVVFPGTRPDINPSYAPSGSALLPTDGDPTKWVYVTPVESRMEKHPVSLVVTFQARLGSNWVGGTDSIAVMTVFHGFVSMAHYNKAIAYCYWKYAPPRGNIWFGPIFDPKLVGEDGHTSPVNMVTLGSSSVVGGPEMENRCASTIMHENMHCGQPLSIRVVERRAESETFGTEILNFEVYGLDAPCHADYRQNTISEFLRNYNQVIDNGEQGLLDIKFWYLFLIWQS